VPIDEAVGDEGSADEVDGVCSPASASRETSSSVGVVSDVASAKPTAGEEESAAATKQRILPGTSRVDIVEQKLADELTIKSKRNKETRPPDGETLIFRSITMAEVYVGSEIDSLTSFLKEVEWVEPAGQVANYIADARRSGEPYEGEFALVSSPPTEPHFGGYGKADLPTGIERIYGRPYVLGPSIVALVLTFALGQDEARIIDARLRGDAEPSIIKSGSFKDVDTVYKIKAKRVRRAREELSNRCLTWLAKTIPGTLAADQGLRVPLCSLVSLATGRPFEDNAEYMRILDLTGLYRAYKFERPDYLFLKRPSSPTREREFIAAFNEEDALAPGSYPDLSATPEITHQEISPLMVAAALEGVFGTLESRMRDIRGSLAGLDFSRKPESRKDRFAGWLGFENETDSLVAGLRNQLLELSRDIAIICGDVAAAVDSPLISMWPEYPRLIPVDPNQSPPGTDESPADLVRKNLRSLATNIQAQEAGLRELVLMTSQAASDTQNTRTQKRLNVLTIALVLLTLGLVFIGIVQIVGTSSSSGSSPSVTPHTSPSATRASVSPTPSPIAPTKSANSHGHGD
jgi:hypothetical protein